MVTRAIQPSIDAEGLLRLQDEFTDRAIAVRELMADTFKSQIATLSALKTEIAKRQGIVDTVEKSAQIRAEADSYAVVVRAKADKINQSAAELLAQANARMAEALDKESRAKDIEEQALSAMTECEQRQKDMDAKQASLVDNISSREAALAKAKADLETARADLNRRQADFSAQLEAVKLVTAS